MLKGIANILEVVFRVITAPIRWLVKAPIRALLSLVLALAVLVVVVPNLVQVLGQRPKLRTVEDVVVEVYGYGDGGLEATGPYDCIMILGAGVRPDGSPSPMLKERLDKGIELYFAGVAPKILMSGDNQSDPLHYNEVENMRRYALAQGVPSEDIFCDHAGICTYDSAYRLYHVFGAHRAILVSQRYHLYRALFDAASFDIQAIGVAADVEEYPVKLFYYAREAAARVSDTWKVLMRQNATYLSEPVPLDQSGEVTSWEY